MFITPALLYTFGTYLRRSSVIIKQYPGTLTLQPAGCLLLQYIYLYAGGPGIPMTVELPSKALHRLSPTPLCIFGDPLFSTQHVQYKYTHHHNYAFCPLDVSLVVQFNAAILPTKPCNCNSVSKPSAILI